MSEAKPDAISRLNAALEGRYTIERQIGEGGMATVYLADDLKHERKVALKVLKPELAAVVGAERFLAEIKTTANLTHPHILPLHDSGEADSFLFYVMPYVEGETLRGRIDREKQLGVKEAVAITQKVANALDYAHGNGVVHRDIKPGNILLSEQGEPLVADFGIALAVAQAGAGRITETGLSLGTPHYMSPEQATGDRDVDPRSDVYALGCVLYEMLSGQPPFSATTAQAVLVKILTADAPSITSERRTVPPHVAAALAQALEKLPADRFTSAAEFAAALGDESFTYEARPRTTIAAPAPAPIAAPPAVTAARPWLRDPRSLVAAVAIGLAAWALLRPAPPIPDGVPTGAQVTGLVMDLGAAGPNTGTRMAISPDGRWIVAGGRSESGVLMLFLRSSADALGWRELPNTETGNSPTFSPEADWVAFTRLGGGIFKVPTTGGPALPVAAEGRNPHWGANDTIVFESGANLYFAPGSGGEAEPLFESPEVVSLWPHMLPDGSGVLFSTGTQGDPLNAQILLYDIETEEVTELVPSGNRPKYVPTGHILYGHGGQALMAVRFDLQTREAGSPTTLIPELTVLASGAAQYDVSTTGTLIYNASAVLGGGGSRSFVEVELDDATATHLDLSPGLLSAPRYSPNGRKIAYEDGAEIRVYDVVTGASPQFTDGGGFYPVWSPGGEYLYFTSTRGGTVDRDGFRRRTDGSQPAEQLFTREGAQFVRAVAAGDSVVIVRENTPDRGRDLLLMRMDADGSVPDSATFEPYLTAEWNEFQAEISPDGRYVAYVSNQEGDERVYVHTFPVPTGIRPVSPGGGTDPRWAPDGGTLYYRDGTTFYAVDVTTDPSFSVGPPRELFDYPTYAIGIGNSVVPSYDVHPDGDRFILTEREGAAPDAGQGQGGEEILTAAQRLQDVYMVANWFTSLKQLMGN